MKVEDLVVGNHYIDSDFPNDPMVYVGVSKEGVYPGHHDFDAIDDKFHSGALCTNEEVEKFIYKVLVDKQESDSG